MFPPGLYTFLEMIQRKRPLSIIEKLSSDELYNHWVSINKQKSNNLNNELINRIEALDKGSLSLDILEKRIRLCNNGTKKEYFQKIYDPLVNGPQRGKINKLFSPLILKKTSTATLIEPNKIHAIFLTDTDYREFEQKIDIFDKKPSSIKMSYFFTLINELARDSKSNFHFKILYFFSEQGRMDSENETKFLKFYFNAIITEPNDQKKNLLE